MDFSTLPGNVSLLHGPADVEQAVDRLAQQINQELRDSTPDKPVLLLCVMTGGIVFAGMLVPRLNFPLEIDYLHATRYGRATVGGVLNWVAKPRQALADRTILLLDDILDEGVTLYHIQDHCRSEGAGRVLTAVLVQKTRERPMPVQADYVGLQVPDLYVFGYGMDCAGLWRNAPGIFALHEKQPVEVSG